MGYLLLWVGGDLLLWVGDLLLCHEHIQQSYLSIRGGPGLPINTKLHSL